MKTLKEVKKNLKKNKVWKKYKNKYRNKQMRLIFSKIIIIFNPTVSINHLVGIEKKYASANFNKQDSMFDNIAKFILKATSYEANWLELCKYIFYVLHTSTYYSKSNIKNIFNKENYIEMNSKKRSHYTNWINTLDINDKTLNTKIRKFLKVVV